jgi:hypothetical protein
MSNNLQFKSNPICNPYLLALRSQIQLQEPSTISVSTHSKNGRYIPLALKYKIVFSVADGFPL